MQREKDNYCSTLKISRNMCSVFDYKLKLLLPFFLHYSYFYIIVKSILQNVRRVFDEKEKYLVI